MVRKTKKTQKHNTICVAQQYTQANTHTVYKTRVLDFVHSYKAVMYFIERCDWCPIKAVLHSLEALPLLYNLHQIETWYINMC
jgi:hypothetical protein